MYLESNIRHINDVSVVPTARRAVPKWPKMIAGLEQTSEFAKMGILLSTVMLS